MSDKPEWASSAEVISARLQRSFGWESERALQVAEIAVDAMCSEFGGRQLYVPRGRSAHKDAVRRDFNGRNIAELSARYGLSCMTIRRYLRKK